MSIFDVFRTKQSRTDALLEQIMRDQQRIMQEFAEFAQQLDTLTQQIDAMRVSNGRTSISGPIKTVASLQTLAGTPHIVQFLRQAGITSKSAPAVQEHDDVLNELALLIGNKYSNIKPLLDQIKRTMQRGETFQLSIQNEIPQAIADMTLIGHKLAAMALIGNFTYKRSPHYMIYARSKNDARAQNFFSGQWLERYIASMVSQYALDAAISDFEILANLQVVLPNGSDFEFDLLVYANQRIYWIETKTGRYQDHIDKYSRLASEFHLPSEQVLLILPDMNDDITTNLSKYYRLNVMNIAQALGFFAQDLKRP